VYEDQSCPSILLDIGFLTCSLSKKEINLGGVHYAQERDNFLKRERGELLEGLEREFAGRQRRILH
jgi:hypothetical protein